jgi:uncharacterized protein
MKCTLSVITIVMCLQLQAQQSALQIDTTKTMYLANQHLTGMGMPKDNARAFSLYLQCAQQGSPRGMNAIGIMYNEGVGTRTDKKKAIEWFTRAGKAGYPKGWYNLALVYKNDTGRLRDYSKAYDAFAKAAKLQDEQSIYAQAYMLYKGLGCGQNYSEAAKLFAHGAVLGKPNSMYFLGLCYRNGYGVEKKADSAKYWLTRAAEKGNRMALGELYSKTAENDNPEAEKLSKQLHAVEKVATASLNRYQKVARQMPADAIEGEYKGYLIKYDWSGKHAINSVELTLEIRYENGLLKGIWKEGKSTGFPFEALLTPQDLVFKHTTYATTDHYSPRKPIPYNFQHAKLHWAQSGDTVFLAGNVQMFSPKRNEPQKPVYISLTRSTPKSTNTTPVTLTNADGTPYALPHALRAYPNPFTDLITIDFELKQSCEVRTQLYTLDGRLVYNNAAGRLGVGYYTLPVRLQHIAAGSYILKLQYGKQSKTVKVVKL